MVILKKLFFLFSFLPLLYSCHLDKDIMVLSFQENDDMVMAPKTGNQDPGFVLQTSMDSLEHIVSVCIRRPDNQLVVYDETQGVILDTFDLRIKQNMEINKVSFIDHESVLVAFNTVYDMDFQDAVLLIIGRGAHVLDTVDIDELPVKTQKHIMFQDPNRYSVCYWDFPLVYKYNKLFVPLLKWNEDGSGPASFIGCLSHSTQGKWHFTKLPIQCAKISKNQYWSSFYSSPRAAASSEHLYVVFPNSPVLYKYSILQDNTSHKKIESCLINEISPYPIGEEAKQYDPYKSSFEKIYYDSIHHRIYVMARIACDSNDSPLALSYENFLYSVMMLDDDMNLLGEGILPEGYYPEIIPYKEGFLLSKKNCQCTTYTYFTPFFQRKPSSFLREQVVEKRKKWNAMAPKMNEKDAMVSYLKRIVGEDFNKYSGFLIFSESSCLNCVPIYCKFLKENKLNILDRSFAVVLINQDKTFIRDFINQSDGELVEPGTIHVSSQIPFYADTNHTYQSFFATWVNARYVRCDATGHIFSDVMINPSNLKDLFAK